MTEDSPVRREHAWLQKYGHLAELQTELNIPLFRYEDFSAAPVCYAPMLFHHCGVTHDPDSYAHIRVVSARRYYASAHWQIRRWQFSKPFQRHLQKYGYEATHIKLSHRLKQQTRLFVRSMGRYMRNQTRGRRK